MVKNKAKDLKKLSELLEYGYSAPTLRRIAKENEDKGLAEKRVGENKRAVWYLSESLLQDKKPKSTKNIKHEKPLKTAVENYKKQIKTLMRENATARSKNTKKEEKIASLKKELNALKKLNNLANKKIDKLEGTLKDFREAFEKQNKESDTYREEFEKQRNEIETLKKEKETELPHRVVPDLAQESKNRNTILIVFGVINVILIGAAIFACKHYNLWK